jgi:hypothetical protein
MPDPSRKGGRAFFIYESLTLYNCKTTLDPHMNRIIKAVLAIILAVQAAAAFAIPVIPAMQPAGTPTMYAVSGILRSTAGGDIIIKVVQGFVVARSQDEAVDLFSRDALIKYPGRSIMDTVATALPIARPTCSLSV